MDEHQAIHRKDYRPPDYRCERLSLRFELGEEATRVASRLSLTRREAGDRPLVLAGRELDLKSVALDGRTLAPSDYTIDDENLTIPSPPAAFELAIETEIKPQENTSLEGLYKSSGVFCTQCEAEGFRRIGYFLDRPDVLSRYETTIVADKAKYPVLLSNGNLVESRDLEQGRHLARWEDPHPKPSYLFALVAGNLVMLEDSFVTQSGREVKLRIYVEPGNLDRCDHAMASLKKAMRWDEETFGREYDLDIFMIVAVADFNMGAMENKGLNVFNARYVLANPETATDTDYLNIEGVIAHEYFHNWTGNRVTCRDWFQLTLKEGLTIFRDQEFSCDMNSRAVERIDDVRRLKALQWPEDAGPTAHPIRPDSYIEINNFYTPTVYEKGAEIIRMIGTFVGKRGFRKGMDLYFERHDGEAVTCEDFVAAMEDANGVDFTQFRRWYAQAGTPELSIESHYDPGVRSFTLTCRQSCPPTPGQSAKEPFHLPLAVALLDGKGRELPLRLEGETGAANTTTRVLDIREEEEVFRFVDVASRPVPSLLRDFSAPVKIQANYSDADLRFLMTRDKNPFNRWEAGQLYAVELIRGLIDDHHAGKELSLDPRFPEAIEASLSERTLDAAFAAEMLSLPSEDYLSECVELIDVDAIHAAREFARKAVAESLHERFAELYKKHTDDGGHRIDVDAMGRRRLKNTCLDYLMALEGPAEIALCFRQFNRAANMTDAVSALRLLADTDRPERDEALAAFYEKWRDDPLVLDKWFTIQAMSRREDTLARVEELARHADFTNRNPNRFRALVSAFAFANRVRFHDASGAGYRFLADQVLELDRLNPQVAARTVSPIGRWRKFDTARQALMRAELERVVGTEGISKDLYEIASKSLA
ncbi:MAG: aminopeptidase N [Alphaproteobacteria bacterium]